MYNNEQLTEIRKQIFTRYIGQRIIKSTEYTGILFVSGNYLDDNRFMSTFCLQLKSLSSITDEDTIEVAKLWLNKVEHPFTEIIVELNKGSFIQYFTKLDGKFYSNYVIEFDRLLPSQHQYLQIKGYATEQTILLENKPITLSVEEQIKLGIIEIIK